MAKKRTRAQKKHSWQTLISQQQTESGLSYTGTFGHTKHPARVERRQPATANSSLVVVDLKKTVFFSLLILVVEFLFYWYLR